MEAARWIMITQAGESPPLTLAEIAERIEASEITETTRLRSEGSDREMLARDAGFFVLPAAPPPKMKRTQPFRRSPWKLDRLTAAALSIAALGCLLRGMSQAMEWPSSPQLALDNPGIIALGAIASRVTWLVASASLVVLLPLWTLTCFGNVRALGGRRRHGAAAAAWGWFIPIANLWWPYQVIEDIRATINRTPNALVVAWWTAWIAGALLQLVVRDHPMANAVTAVASALGAMAVLALSREQHEAIKGASASGAPRLAR